jgi:hypothetical protein
MDPSRAYSNEEEELGGGNSSLPPHIRLLLQSRAAMSQVPLAYPQPAAAYGRSSSNPYPLAPDPHLSPWSTMVAQPQWPIIQDPVSLNAMNVNAMLAAVAYEQRRRDAETSSRLLALMGHQSRFDPASTMAASAAFSMSPVSQVRSSPSRYDDLHGSRPLETKPAAATPSQAASSRSRISASCETPEEATRTLKILGSTLRIKGDPFIDAALITDPGASVSVRGGRSEYFPDKLYSCLEETEKEGLTDVCGWLPHGRYVHNLNVEPSLYWTQGSTHRTSHSRTTERSKFGMRTASLRRSCLASSVVSRSFQVLRGRYGKE